MARLESGSVLSGYRIESVAGEGGMGVVYRATQIALGRPVALKLIASELASDPEFRVRFQRESRVAASIEHPHVLPVYEAGEADGRLFISMRYVDGVDLRALILQEAEIDPRRAARILAQVAAALDAAHAAGLVHRDIKPGNVLIARQDGEDHAYLTDFGLTKQLGSQSGVTKTGTWVGTLDYMAPEQIRGEPVDARTDVYALGCVAYQMISGRVPFERDSDVAKLWAHMNEPPPRLSEAAPGIAKEADLVIGRAMAKDSDERQPSAGDLARGFSAAVEGRRIDQPERSVARGEAAPEPTRRGAISRTRVRARPPTKAGAVSERRWPPVSLAVGAVAALVLGGIVLAATGALSGDDGGDGGEVFRAQASGAFTQVLTSIPVERPTGIALGAGRVWITSYDHNRLTAVDEATGAMGDPIETGEGPGALAVGGGDVLIANTDAGTISRVELESGRVVGNPIQVGAATGDSLEFGEDGLWAVTPFEGRLSLIDPGSGEVTRSVRPRGGLNGELALGAGAVWVVGSKTATVQGIDPGSGRPSGAPIVVGENFEQEFGGQVAFGEGAVWATSPDDNQIVRIDPDAGEVVATLAYEPGVQGEIAAGLGSVWFASDNGHIVRIDPATNKIVGPLTPGPGGVEEIEVGDGVLWLRGDPELNSLVRLDPDG